ncbi:MAG: ABC transporter substrate-binding protein [Alphaproteobacteria bacterium]|nr:ABC transporter substrate-binding protein [Alphaproteobacteria bacterium]
MKIKHFLQLIILFLTFCLAASFSSAADFSADEARAWVDNKGKQILDIMTSTEREEKFEQLDSLLFNDVDLEYAAQFVVGKYWKDMTEEQKEKYFELFKKYTSSLYKGYPLEIEKGVVTYTVDKVIADKDSQYVHCSIFINPKENKVDENTQVSIEVIFRLVKNGERIQVRDIKVTETSFLLAYRERFYKILHDDDGDIDWFLEDLAQMTADLEAENQKASE